MEQLAAVLIAARALADFSLQTEGLVRQKGRFNFLLLHGLIHATASYAILQTWFCWQAPAIILPLHMLIDSLKQRFGRDSVASFVSERF